MLDRVDLDPSRAPWAEADAGDERALLCASCAHPITLTARAIDVAGAHAHVFMNPAGYVFEIGCFSDAPGAASAGPTSGEWSWFPGHRWAVSVCRRCSAHVGWSFSEQGGSARFVGLILDRLKEG